MSSLQLPSAPDAYSKADQAAVRLLLQAFARQVLGLGEDIETGRIILTSPSGNRFVLGVDDLGALTTTAL